MDWIVEARIRANASLESAAGSFQLAEELYLRPTFTSLHNFSRRLDAGQLRDS